MTQEAKKFVEFWTFQRGSEKGEDQKFWNALLADVLGVEDITTFIQYQVPVHFKGTTKFLDAWIPSTRVLIEHKTRGVDLDAPQAGHDGQTPFQQAWDYDNNRPVREKARWIVVCNFDEIRIHDMNADVPETTFERITLGHLAKEVHRLKFLVQSENAIRARELEVSVKAGRVVGKLYGAFLESYGESAKDPEVLKALNKLCVRLVFCVYAEDAGVFAKDQFLDFMRKFHFSSFHLQLTELFKVLRLKPEERGPFFSDELKAFPYVGGGLFKEDIPIAPFSEKTAKILLDDASEQFDWSEISPTIFGAVFESTLNPETRRKDGMHYTSEENIHKVIDPLFLDAFRAELEEIKKEPNLKKRNASLTAFQEKLGALRFLDPACGSGNFLTETYISLRKLENEALALRFKGQGQFDLEDKKFIHVSINQFYGIEINDFAVTVAQTAMWIAECKMMQETSALLAKNFTPLPLTDSANIFEGNALKMDWGDLISRETRSARDSRAQVDAGVLVGHEHYGADGRARTPAAPHFDFIMGNPPFVGASMMTAEQKAEAVAIFGKGKRVNSIDYVGAWYYKACEYAAGGLPGGQPLPVVVGGDHRAPRCAFVSTNSLCQGEQVAPFWSKLYANYGLEIDFAWTTFVWDSEATEKAHVHVVVVGFHTGDFQHRGTETRSGGLIETALPPGGVSPNDVSPNGRVTSMRSPHEKRIFNADGTCPIAKNINPYLIDAPTAFVESRGHPICDVLKMTKGSYASDGGNLILSQEECDTLLKDVLRPDFIKSGLDADPQFAKCGSGGSALSLADCVRRFVGARDFINNDEVRYCLWLKGIPPSVYRDNAEVMRRLAAVREMRLKSTAAPTRAMAETPYLFFSSPHSEAPYLLLPEVSSERRRYIPIGFMPPEVIAANTTLVVPNATLYHFGVLTSSVHMAWMRVVAGRLEMRYRYSAAIVYNNFPWPDGGRGATALPTGGGALGDRALPTGGGALGDRALPSPDGAVGVSPNPVNPVNPVENAISQTAQSILDARALYPDSSLADLYDPLTMPPELRKAHQANDAAVMKAYGFPSDLDEAGIVSRLFEMYAEMVGKAKGGK